MVEVNRNQILEQIRTELEEVRLRAAGAHQTAISFSSASPSESGDRAKAESDDNFWRDKLSKLTQLEQQLSKGGNTRVDLGTIAEVEIDGETMTVIYSDLNLQLSSGLRVLTPSSPIGKAVTGAGEGSSFTVNSVVPVKIKKVF